MRDVPESEGEEFAPPKKAATRRTAAKKAPAAKKAARATKAPAAKKAPAVKKASVTKKAPAARKASVTTKAPAAEKTARAAVRRPAPPPLDVPVPQDDDVLDEAATQEAPRWTPSEAPAAAPSPPPVTPPAPVYTQPPPPKRGAGRTVAVVGGAAVVAALVVIGLVIGIGKLVGEDGVKYSELQAGDCFERPSGRFKNVNTVACDQSHDLEVYAVVDHPAAAGDPFPGMDELVRYASPLCLAQFSAYAGVPFEQLNLQDVYITPRDSAWKDGGRKLVCAVGAQGDEPRTSSIRAGA